MLCSGTKVCLFNAAEAALRELHAELPQRPGFWNRHLEGSYAVAGDLRTPDGLGRQWLYVDHGSDRLEWSGHCNQPWTRWILREHGITLVGPCAVEIVRLRQPSVITRHGEPRDSSESLKLA